MENMKKEFETWVKYERKQSIEQYDKFPFSYKIPEVNAMWESWKACWKYLNSYAVNYVKS